MSRRLLFLYIPRLLILFSFSCKSPSGPEPIKNPREYTWMVDTLYISQAQILMDAVWGSANDLYTVGHSAGAVGTMWHYDGNRWTNVKLGAFEGGTIETFSSNYELHGIHGLNPSNAFAVGNRRYGVGVDSSFIIQYDGKQWREHLHRRGGILQSVWVNSPSDVWACGLNGTLLHFDGIQWKKDSVTVTTPPGSTFYLSSIARSPTGELFMLGAAYEFGTPQVAERWTYYFFRREGDTWKLLDSFVRNGGERLGKWGGHRLVVIANDKLYSVDSYGFFRLEGGAWKKIYENTTYQLTGAFGTSDHNLFVTGTYGLLAHYNGTDWFQYTNLLFQNGLYASGWADERQVFVTGWVGGEKTIVLHGK